MTDLHAPLLRFQAEILDDLERTRIANENRLRQLTRSEDDADGERRGFGMTAENPEVARLGAIVSGLASLEKEAVKSLTAELKRHPLFPWIKAQHGIGDKTAARLLAAIGDPYWNDTEDRPRLVSELWQYAGHGDPQRSRRVRGQQTAYSPDAKMRLFLIAESTMKLGKGTDSPWRKSYDERKAATEGRIHGLPCPRCTAKGTSAITALGTPWKDAHRHADALRIVGKEILRGLWYEARRLHGED